MKAWMSAIPLILAGTMLAGSAFAQTTAPSGEPKAKESTGSAGKSDSMKSDTGMKSGGGAGMAGKSEQVKAVQQALKDKGHDPGAVDGKMGPKTQAALRDFQSKEGLKASGRLDSETMAKLGVEAKAGASAGGSTTPSASPSGTAGSGTTPGSKSPGTTPSTGSGTSSGSGATGTKK
jgi:peptidoglycan hydrolase-like protein with peptidoglycan-binding domain